MVWGHPAATAAERSCQHYVISVFGIAAAGGAGLWASGFPRGRGHLRREPLQGAVGGRGAGRGVQLAPLLLRLRPLQAGRI